MKGIHNKRNNKRGGAAKAIVTTSEVIEDKDLRCAPAKKYENGSCITVDVLIKMVDAYNEHYQTNKIPVFPEVAQQDPKRYKKYLIKQLDMRLDSVCDDQRCWIEQPFIKKMDKLLQEELTDYTFRPKGPREKPDKDGNFEWLDTYDILDVMHQYEKVYPDYKFIGAVPLDFQDLPRLKITSAHLDEFVRNGKTKIGVIYNLDKHNQPGSHWVAGFFDLNKGFIYYFDSYGIKPLKETNDFMNKIKQWMENRGIQPKIDYNKIRHQYGGSECGVYSISTILRLLKGDTFDTICKQKTPDEKISVCRKVYYT